MLVHGSSHTCVDVADLITSIVVYYDHKWQRTHCRDNLFRHLRHNKHEPYVVVAVELRVVSQFFLTRYTSFQPEGHLVIVSDALLTCNRIFQMLCSSWSTTIQWYPHRKRLTIWKTQLTVDDHTNKTILDLFPRRRYSFEYALLCNRRMTQGMSHDILGSWKSITGVENFFMDRTGQINLELLVP